MEFVFLLTLFVILLFVYFHYKKAYDLGFFIVLIISLFSLISVLFYFHPVFPSTIHSGDASYVASLFLFCCYFLWLLPVLKYKSSNIESIEVSKFKIHFLARLSVVTSFVFILTVLPDAIEGINVADFAEHKDEVVREGVRYSNNIIIIPFVFLYSYIRPVLILVFFYFLCFFPRKNILTHLLGVSTFLPPLVQAFATSHRYAVAFLFLDTIVAFLIFYRFIPKRILKTITIVSFIVSLLFIYVIVDFSNKRFSKFERIGAEFFLLKYAGEGMVNFNTLLYDNTQVLSYGDNSFPLMRKTLGLRYHERVVERRSYWGNKVNYPTYLFYSFIGAFVGDIGRLMTFLMSFLLGFIAWNNIRHRGNTVKFSDVMLVFFFASLCLQGVFYFPYISVVGNLRVVFYFALYFLFKYKFVFRSKAISPL